jgi:hypothetical protein
MKFCFIYQEIRRLLEISKVYYQAAKIRAFTLCIHTTKSENLGTITYILARLKY